MNDLRPHPVRVKVWRQHLRWHWEWRRVGDEKWNPTAAPTTGSAWTETGMRARIGAQVGSWLIGLALHQQDRREFILMLDVPGK